MKKPDLSKLQGLIAAAVEEDLGRGDLTTEITIGPDVWGKAHIITREEIVVCGMDIAKEVLKHYDKNTYPTGRGQTSPTDSAQSRGRFGRC